MRKIAPALVPWTTSHSLVIAGGLESDNAILSVNEAFCELTGYSVAEVMGRNCRFLQGPDTDRQVVAEIAAALKAGQPIRRELLNYRKDGTPFWVDLVIDPVKGKKGDVTGYMAIQSDVTAKHLAFVGARQAEDRLKNIVDHLPGLIFEQVLAPDGGLTFTLIASKITHELGLPEVSIDLRKDIYRWMEPGEAAQQMEAIQRSAQGMTPLTEEFRLRSPAGVERWFRHMATPRPGFDGSVVWSGVALDITAEKLSRTKADYLTSHDPLTTLLNRPLFRETLVRTIAALEPENDQTVLLYIDLDEFQAINDTLGTTAGDKVLRRIGLRLLEFAEARGGVCARLGGDEFAVMLPGQALDVDVMAQAERARTFLSQVMFLEGQEVLASACVGAASFPRLSNVSQLAAGDEWAAELMKRAQVALYAAKREGAGVSRVYSSSLDDRFQHRQALRQSLQQAINAEQFELHYQPIVKLDTGEIVGVEALVRWNHPQFGMQRPDLFIPIAESSGLIVQLGAWVMRTAMQQRLLWARRGLRVPRVSVNVSSMQLRRPGFVPMVEAALLEAEADPRDFELELTEGTLLEASPDIQAQLLALKAMGFSLAIDDFGVGHSTFRYLRDFPADRMKIDQTFIRQLVLNSNDVPIIRAMLALAQSLDLEVVAEGIETTMQWDFLRTEGCGFGQGYLFSMPMTAEDFGWMLTGGVRLPLTAEAPSTERSSAPEDPVSKRLPRDRRSASASTPSEHVNPKGAA